MNPLPGLPVAPVQALRRAGLLTGIITHGWTTKQAEKIVRLGLVPHLDPGAVFISDQLGISKPNPKIYSIALRDLGLKASEAMYVGDNPTHDVTPPKSIGMIAVWARRAARHGLDCRVETPFAIAGEQSMQMPTRDPSLRGHLPDGCFVGDDLEDGDTSLRHPPTLRPDSDGAPVADPPAGPPGRPPGRLPVGGVTHVPTHR